MNEVQFDLERGKDNPNWANFFDQIEIDGFPVGIDVAEIDGSGNLVDEVTRTILDSQDGQRLTFTENIYNGSQILKLENAINTSSIELGDWQYIRGTNNGNDNYSASPALGYPANYPAVLMAGLYNSNHQIPEFIRNTAYQIHENIHDIIVQSRSIGRIVVYPTGLLAEHTINTSGGTLRTVCHPTVLIDNLKEKYHFGFEWIPNHPMYTDTPIFFTSHHSGKRASVSASIRFMGYFGLNGDLTLVPFIASLRPGCVTDL